jgi:hypothetical protein
MPDPDSGAAWHQSVLGEARLLKGVSQTVKLACFQAIGDAGLAVEGFGTFDHRLRVVLDPHSGIGGVRAEASQQVELTGIVKLE